VIVRLRGQGHLSIHLGPEDRVRYSCDGVPRYVASGEVRISAARGCVVLEGEFLGLSFHGGVVDALFLGAFEAPPRQGGAGRAG